MKELSRRSSRAVVEGDKPKSALNDDEDSVKEAKAERGYLASMLCDKTSCFWKHFALVFFLLAFVAIVVAIVIPVLMAWKESELGHTLISIRKRGLLRCGVPRNDPGKSVMNETTEVRTGFNIDLVRLYLCFAGGLWLA
jgi:hypothetical protein